jgi:hypothetical protein
VGELGLVEEIDAFREPFEGWDHVDFSLSRMGGGGRMRDGFAAV